MLKRDNKAVSLYLSRAEAGEIERAMNWREGDKESDRFSGHDGVVYTAKFPDGKQIDVKCNGVDYEEGGCNSAWAEAVLFDANGTELACSEPSDDFFGDWLLDYDGNTYWVHVDVRPTYYERIEVA